MTKLNVLFAAGLMAVTLSPLANAKDDSAVPEVTVYYDEMKLAANGAANDLYKKLRTASREVCGQFRGRELRHRAAFDACYSRALSNAVLHVNRSAVTALHERAKKGTKES